MEIIADTLAPRQFKNNKRLSEIKLGKSIQVIPRECFQGCTKLKRIIIPSSVKNIGFQAFAGSSIEEVIFEDGSSLRILSARCFESCLNLTQFIFPSTIRIIGDSSFKGCGNLRGKVIISASIREIGASAFAKCGLSHLQILASEILYNEKNNAMSVNIGGWAFSQCQNLESCAILSPIRSIGKYMFYGSSIMSVEFSRDSHLKSISNYMFSFCNNLRDFTFPSSIISIGTSAFASSRIDNEMFALIFANYNIQHIGEHAFSSCPNLTSITIPSNVVSIGKCAFMDSNIHKVEFLHNSNLETISESIFEDCSHLEVITITSSSINSIGPNAFAKSGINDESFDNIFSNCNIQRIGQHAFSMCLGLRFIVIPSSVQVISESVFASSKIISIQFLPGSHLEIISDYLFQECLELRSVLLPPSVKSIGMGSFYNNAITDTSFAQIFTNTNIESIGEEAFSGCVNLSSITIPASVKSIGEFAFSDLCVENVEFEQDSQLTTIAKGMFAECRNLSDVKLPPSVKSIYDSAFEKTYLNDESIAYIFENCNIQHIGTQAFFRAESFKSLTIPSSVISISSLAFSGTNLEYVEFSPNSQLDTIPDRIFADCQNLKVVVLPPSIKVIQHRAFMYCTSLQSVKIPPSVESIHKAAFAYTPVETISSKMSRCQIN